MLKRMRAYLLKPLSLASHWVLLFCWQKDTKEGAILASLGRLSKSNVLFQEENYMFPVNIPASIQAAAFWITWSFQLITQTRDGYEPQLGCLAQFSATLTQVFCFEPKYMLSEPPERPFHNPHSVLKLGSWMWCYDPYNLGQEYLKDCILPYKPCHAFRPLS